MKIQNSKRGGEVHATHRARARFGCVQHRAGRNAGTRPEPALQYANNEINDNGTLTTSFKEVGLGTGTDSVRITLTANATAVYQCFNNGGHHPKAGNKETLQSDVITSGDFPVRNGQTTGSLIVGPLDPGGFSCPSGQTLFLESVKYSNTFVSDAAGNTLKATPDPISRELHIQV
ncbi:hypothetical protein [Streptomyces sp. NPDC001816]|uniref:hypothetical protein n=1 Tax=Streptomyces sp. NPDC001816 TaxID=3364612 RepID=UPI0036AD15B4